MTFSIIGTGNIAWFFGTRLVAGRHHCTGVYARDTAAAKKLADTLLSDHSGAIDDIQDGHADICLLAVSDIAIGKIAARLSFKQTMVIHTAGAVRIDAIKDMAIDCAVLWPIYSILKTSMPTHRDIPCAWEASTVKAEKYVQSLGHAITDNLFEAKHEQRKWLHLAAVMSNNFINHLMAVCEQICTENDLPFSVLQPIIAQTFERATHAHPAEIQTGPAIRRDSSTIQEQLALLNKHRNWQEIYEAITSSIQQMAGNK
jgi:predicted short-subunit dehydrogenase-like oxidoreductase (DUF2520 family)